MAATKILVIEDEADILELLVYNLQREGYRVLSCRDGDEGLAVALQELPDLILLDLMLPGLDGIEVCRRLKADISSSAIPIIMVSAKGEESDVVLGLGVGADDYVAKPFSPRELTARIKAVLRRSPGRDAAGGLDIIKRAGLLIDAPKYQVRVDGERIFFTATEFRLLHYLARHPGRVFTRAQLLDRCLSEDSIVIDRNIDVHIRAIRKKLDGYQHLIETQRGVGYRFRDLED